MAVRILSLLTCVLIVVGSAPEKKCWTENVCDWLRTQGSWHSGYIIETMCPKLAETRDCFESAVEPKCGDSREDFTLLKLLEFKCSPQGRRAMHSLEYAPCRKDVQKYQEAQMKIMTCQEDFCQGETCVNCPVYKDQPGTIYAVERCTVNGVRELCGEDMASIYYNFFQVFNASCAMDI